MFGNSDYQDDEHLFFETSGLIHWSRKYPLAMMLYKMYENIVVNLRVVSQIVSQTISLVWSRLKHQTKT